MAHRWGIVSLPSVLVALACGGNPELPSSEDDPGNPRAGASSGGAGGVAGRPNIGLPGGGDAGATANGGTGGTGRCTPKCGAGQRCELDSGEAQCVDNTCDDLDCGAREECQPAPSGGFVCESIACKSDVDCPTERYCDGEKCVDDACEAETRTCSGDKLLVCASNGSAEESPYTCKSAGYFESQCSDSDPNVIACTCEGDWDCPQYTVCETGACKGTGVEPTCTLPATPFEDVLPEREFRWGGTSTAQEERDAANDDAVGKAFPWSAQVGSPPIIVNLDDDNGDGFVNELDFPEIVFMTYEDDPPGENGIIRAVHGGGPRKGEDYFALCDTEHWFEGDTIPTDCDPAAGDAQSKADANGRASGGLAAGDLDGDGLPEIVVPLEGGAIRILNNRGEIVTTSAAGQIPSADKLWNYPAPAIANLDFEGLPEIVVGNRVFVLALESGALRFARTFRGTARTGTMLHLNKGVAEEQHHGPTVCVSDISEAHAGLEIVAGTSAYTLPAPVDCDDAANADTDYCEGLLTVVWDAEDVNPDSDFYPEGFCAVADVLGADAALAPGPDNPLDEVPEVLVIADGELLILEGASGALLAQRALGGGRSGGAPNVDDFDGDGFPEIATALENFYTVVDLQEPVEESCPAWPTLLGPAEPSPGSNPPRDPGGRCTDDGDCNAGAVCNERAGACVCLHSGWRRDTEDDSSRVTSSSVFDFNGDGAAEVVYNDECYFRVYDGSSGGIYLAIPSLSRTLIENPVVADVDNDGNAEIVFVQNNEELQCGETNLDSWPDGADDVPRASLPNGLEVWGDPSDVWVAARRIWNQHSYHVTNVTEGGAIPLHEPENFRPLNGRLYNTYRSQPRNYGVAPDLALVEIQVSSPDVACGELSDRIQISVLVKNEGDLRVGPGVVVEFEGAFANGDERTALVDSNGDPLAVTLDKSLEPGASTIVTVDYEAGNGGMDELPVEVSAVIDRENRERECDEDDNEISAPVEAGDELADLRVVIANGACSQVRATVHNDGTLPAEEVVVRVYAGDPSQGGQILGEETIAGPIEPGESATVPIRYDSLNRDVTLYVVADPDNTIAECNDANNSATDAILCYVTR